MVAWLLAALLASETGLVHELGVIVRENAGTLRVTRVIQGSRADHAGVHEGQYIVAIGGVEVASLYDLRRQMRNHGDEALDVEVSDTSPSRGTFWVGPSVTGNGVTGQDGTQSSWLGVMAAIEVTPNVRLLGGVGYVAVGERPFVGRDGFAPVIGLQGEYPLIDVFFVPFVRGLVGPNFTWHSSNRLIAPDSEFDGSEEAWTQTPFNALLQAGTRIWWIEGAVSAGLGPARAINVGVNFTVWVPFGSLFD